MKSFSLVAVCLLTALSATRAETVVIADFEKDTGGFGELLKQDTTMAQAGQASGKIDVDLSKPGARWINLDYELDYKNEITALRFRAKSTDVKGFTFEMIDSSGQTHQQRPSLQPTGEWQPIEIKSFTSGPQYKKWGGANDGKFHSPAQKFRLLVEQGNLSSGNHGTVWIDEVALDMEGPPHRRADDFRWQTLTDFETGKAVFSGSMETDGTVAHGGQRAGKMTADFTQGGRWITATCALQLSYELGALRFWVKSSDANGLTVRLVDATGQTHQQRPAFNPTGEWQQISISTFTAGRGYQKWGGANDGKFHWPAKDLSFILEDANLAGKKSGTVWLDDVEVALGEKIVPLLEFHQTQLGNIFNTDEKVSLGVETQGDRLEWTVTDFFQTVVATHATPVKDGAGRIEPDVNRPGYYEIHVTAKKGDATVAAGLTAFAIITPVDITKMPNSPFGVMTHFAQGWDTDIIPLIAKAGITSVRDELYWDQVEKKPGEYAFNERQEAYMAALATNHIDPLIVMSFANKNYDGGNTPYTPEGCEAYANYGLEILKHYGQQIKWLEIWNEYNGSFCKGPATNDRPRYYTQMLKAAYTKIKEVRPDVTVIGGAAVLMPPPYFEGIFKNGGLPFMDALAVHPYRQHPERVDVELAELHDLVKKYNDGQTKPIWVTETGRIDTSPAGRTYVAQYIPRQCALLLSAGVPMIHWYLCRDYSTFVSMGLFRDPNTKMGRYAPAPAFAAYATVIRQLYDAKFIRRELTADRTYVELFEKDGRQLRVAWATVPAQLTLATKSPVTLVDLMGAEQTLTPVNGQVFVTLTENAVYLKGDATLVDAPLFAARQTAAVLGPVKLRFDTPVKGTIELLGKTCAVPGELVLPEQDTSTPREQTIWYKFTAAGKLAGVGGLRLAVVEPLTFTRVAELPAANQLVVRLGNTAAQLAYTVTKVTWKLGGVAREQTVAASVPAGQQLVLALPVEPVELNREYEAAVVVTLTNRASLEYHGMVMCQTTGAGPAEFATKLEQLPSHVKAGEVVADSVLDYGKDQGGNNWTYGYIVAGKFEPMKFTETMWGYNWRVEDIRYLVLHPNGGHPGLRDAKPVWAVRRWTSPVDGPVRITGRVSSGEQGDGTGGVVLVDGVVVWNQLTGSANKLPPAECDVVATVKKGSTVDFAITPGPTANTEYDAATFTAQITRVLP